MADEPAKDAAAPNADAADSDATVITRDDTSTRTVAATPRPAPTVPPLPGRAPAAGAAEAGSGGVARDAATVVSRVDDATRTPGDEATRTHGGEATRAPAMPPPPPAPPRAPTPPPPAASDATRVVSPGSAPPIAPTPRPAPPAAPSPTRAADDATATRTVAARPAPPPTPKQPAPGAPTAAAPPQPTAAPAPPPPAADAPTLSRHVDVGDDATVVRVAPRGRPRLILTDEEGKREVALASPDVSIGRAKTCDVILTNAEVSRLHARIVLRGADHVLVPVGARRNTYVNGELALDERLLRHGDVVRLASEELVYAEEEHVGRESRGAGEGAGRAGTSLALGAALAAAAAGFALWLLWTPRSPPPDAPVAPPAAANAPAGNVAVAPEPAAPPAAPPAVAPAVPPPAPAAGGRGEQVSKLIYEGDIAFVEKKYTTPTEGSALYAYQEALKLDPQNARARSQIALIIDRYLDLAERALTANDRAGARLYTDKAAYVHEQVAEVGDRDDIERRLDALSKRLGSAPRR